jgi:hypothetical protein
MMDLEKILVALLLSCLAFVGLFTATFDMSKEYNKPVTNDKYNYVYQEVNTTFWNSSGMVSGAYQNLENTTSISVSSIDDIFQSAFNSIRLFFKLPALLNGMIESLAIAIGIPNTGGWFINALSTIVVAIIFFSVAVAVLTRVFK